MTPAVTLAAPTGGAAPLVVVVKDTAQGREVLNYTASLEIKPDGNLSVRKDRTWMDEDHWTAIPGPAIVISYGHAAAYLVVDAFVSNDMANSVVITWGVDQNGDGDVTNAELSTVEATPPRWRDQQFYERLPVSTSFVMTLTSGGTQLGSIRGTFYLAGLPTLKSEISQPIAPLQAARIAAFRLPQNVVVEVNGTEFITETTSRQQPGAADALPIMAGQGPPDMPLLAPECDPGRAFTVGIGCQTPKPTDPHAVSPSGEVIKDPQSLPQESTFSVNGFFEIAVRVAKNSVPYLFVGALVLGLLLAGARKLRQ